MENILLVGSGPMGLAYADVLKALNKEFTVIGRGEKSAVTFENKSGIKVFSGGLSQYLKTNTVLENSVGIIATGTENLMSNLLELIEAGISKILIEKPAAISIQELLQNEDRLRPLASKIFVAYNRRFYSSVIMARELIEEDGGLQSMHFEFTEWANKIEPLLKAPGVKENWFFANSTHVIDLAFYFGGLPTNWSAFTKAGTLNWHDKSIYTGAGVTNENVLFSYHSNWESAGRWGVELLTKKRRIYLKPLESLQVQLLDSIEVKEIALDNSLDTNFKPGVYRQVQAFLKEGEGLLDLQMHLNIAGNVYEKILNG